MYVKEGQRNLKLRKKPECGADEDCTALATASIYSTEHELKGILVTGRAATSDSY
jgi:hypothetical protein